MKTLLNKNVHINIIYRNPITKIKHWYTLTLVPLTAGTACGFGGSAGCIAAGSLLAVADGLLAATGFLTGLGSGFSSSSTESYLSERTY